MGNCILHNLNSTLTIVCDNIPPDIRLTMLSENNDTIIGTLLDFVSPDERH